MARSRSRCLAERSTEGVTLTAVRGRCGQTLGCAHGRRVPSMMRSATARILERSLIAVRWMNVKASCSRVSELVHQHALGPLDRLARLELLAEGVDLAGHRPQLAEPPDGDLDGRHEIALLERLDEVGQCAGVARLLDHLALAEGGQHQHAAQLLAVDDPRRLEPVDARHLDVEDRQVGQQVTDEVDGRVAATGLADDLVALLLQRLAQVHADDGFVFGDHDADRHAASFRAGTPIQVHRGATCRPVTVTAFPDHAGPVRQRWRALRRQL